MVRRIILKSSSSSIGNSSSSSSSFSSGTSSVASIISNTSGDYSEEDDDFTNTYPLSSSSKLTARQRSKIEKETFGDFEGPIQNLKAILPPSEEVLIKKEHESRKRRLQKDNQMLKDKNELIGKLLQKQKCAQQNTKNGADFVDDETFERIRKENYHSHMKELDNHLMNPNIGKYVYIDNEHSKGKTMIVNREFLNKYI